MLQNEAKTATSRMAKIIAIDSDVWPRTDTTDVWEPRSRYLLSTPIYSTKLREETEEEKDEAEDEEEEGEQI